MILAGCARIDNSLSGVKLCKCKDIPSKCLEQIWSDRVIFILDQFFVSCYCDIIWIFSATEQVSNWIFFLSGSKGTKGCIHCLRMRSTEVWKLTQRCLKQLLTNKAVECPVLKGVSRCVGESNGAWLHPIPCAKLSYHVLSVATHPEGFHGWVSESHWLHFFVSF